MITMKPSGFYLKTKFYLRQPESVQLPIEGRVYFFNIKDGGKSIESVL